MVVETVACNEGGRSRKVERSKEESPENAGEQGDVLLMAVNSDMRMAQRQHEVANEGNNLSQSKQLNQKEKRKSSQKNVSPVSGCWPHKAIWWRQNRSHGSEFPSGL